MPLKSLPDGWKQFSGGLRWRCAGQTRTDALGQLAMGLAADSVFAAELTLTCFNRKNASHNLEPPLMAAVYNAGSLRLSLKNPWHMVQYGEHIDRWVAFYNTSRKPALE